MKRGLIALAILCLACPVSATPDVFDVTRDPGQFGLFLSGGLNVPQGDLADMASSGSAIGGGLSYNFTSRFTIGGEIFANHYDMDSDIQSAFGDDAKASVNIIQYTGFMKMMVTPLSRHQAYLKGAAGIYTGQIEIVIDSYELKGSTSEFGFGVGGGYQLNGRKNAALYVESLFHHIVADGGGADYITVSMGVLFNLK